MCECKWKQHWVNQGLVGCEKNRPELRFDECDSGCPLREIVETLSGISSSASTYSSRPVSHASPIYDPPRKRHKDKAKHKKYCRGKLGSENLWRGD